MGLKLESTPIRDPNRVGRRAAVVVAAALTLGLVPGCGPRKRPQSPDESAGVRAAGAEADAVGNAVEKLVRRAAAASAADERDGAVRAIVAMGEPGVARLAKVLRDEDEDIRDVAVEAIGEIGGAAAVGALVGALGDENWEVRLKAVEALGGIRDRRAAKPLMDQYAKDEDDQVRYECLTSLGLIGDPAARPLLLKEIRHEGPYVRMWAMDALCQMRDPDAPELARGLVLRDPSPLVVRQVLISCAEAFKNAAGYGTLISLALSADDFETTVWARRHLMAVVQGGGPESAALAERVRRGAREALSGNDSLRAALVLGELGDPIAADRLIEAMGDANVLVRHHAAYQLGTLGDRRAVPALIQALGERSSLVSVVARESLRRFAAAGDKRASQALEAAAGSERPLGSP